MKILKDTNDKNILLNSEQNFKVDLGWEDSFQTFEDEILKDIINPSENYETVRYIHKPYISEDGYSQTDIWFYFYFLDGSDVYTNGIDYNLKGITPKENAMMLRQSTETFFRLEFYKTPNGEDPTQNNRRLVFAKNLSLPLGEKFYYITLRDYIFVPVFMGSNYKNKENMYFFWFTDDTPFDESNLTGNTFYMTAKFFNADQGTVDDFTNNPLDSGVEVNETNDLYYKVEIDRSDFSYQVFEFNYVNQNQVGQTNNPIKFYEKRT